MTNKEVERCIECLQEQISEECNDEYDKLVASLGPSWDMDRRLSFAAGMDFAIKFVEKKRELHTLFKGE